MNTFIHTFSVITHLYLSEKELLERAFREDFFFNSTEKIFVLQTYTKHGVRIHIKHNPKNEKRYDKKQSAIICSVSTRSPTSTMGRWLMQVPALLRANLVR